MAAMGPLTPGGSGDADSKSMSSGAGPGGVRAMRVTALVLCGGRGSRMGGVDKPLELFQGRPLVHHVLERIAPQVQGRVVISANRHQAVYERLGYPVLADSLSDFQGPLAGMLAGMTFLRTSQGQAGDTAAVEGDEWVLCVSGDSPWLPVDLLQRLAAPLGVGSGPVVGSGAWGGHALSGSPASGGAQDTSPDSAMAWGREAPGAPLRSQPLASLIHTRHQPALSDALARGERRVEAWLRTLPLAEVPFDRPQDDHAFANINDRSQLERPHPAP